MSKDCNDGEDAAGDDGVDGAEMDSGGQDRARGGTASRGRHSESWVRLSQRVGRQRSGGMVVV